MILAIERAWGREPGWFGTLDADTQARLMADHRMTLEAGTTKKPPPAAGTRRGRRGR